MFVVLALTDFALPSWKLPRLTFGVAGRRGTTVKFGSVLYRWNKKREYCINCFSWALYSLFFWKFKKCHLFGKKNSEEIIDVTNYSLAANLINAA
jgi:hypothetical protein